MRTDQRRSGGVGSLRRTLVACLVRGFQESQNYRLALLLRLASAALTLATLYFVSGVVDVGRLGAMAASGYLPFSLVGVAFFQLQHAVATAYPHAARYAQLSGTLEALASSPTPIWQVLVCLPAHRLMVAGASATLLLLCAFMFNPTQHWAGGLLVASIVLPVSCLAFVGQGLCGGALTLITRQTDQLAPLVAALSLVTSGVLYPRSVLPWPLQMMGLCFPLTHAVSLTRRLLLAQGSEGAQIMAPLAALFVASSAVFVLGLACLFAALRGARRRGMLSGY